MAALCNDKTRHPVLAVVGPTATGKTALGVALAERFGGEVISADSMQIYKGLDVGTAKVTLEETHGIPHHGVDIRTPDQLFSVADFCAMAGELEQELFTRNALPILVGGTGLYVQSFLYGVRFTKEKAPDGLREQLAAELAEKGPEAMYAQLQAVDPEAAAAIHPNNQVRVLRALEHYRATGKRLSEQKAESLPAERPYRSLVLGLDFPERAQGYLERFRRDCLTLCRPVRVLYPGGTREGTAVDITEDFGLTVRWPDGTVEAVTSGEVSVRGLYGYV